MSSYKEIKKIARASTIDKSLNETIISVSRGKTSFVSGSVINNRYKQGATQIKISQDYGTGLHLQLTKFNKERATQLSVELGAAEVDVLLEYLNSIRPSLKNYNGEYIQTQLIELK